MAVLYWTPSKSADVLAVTSATKTQAVLTVIFYLIYNELASYLQYIICANLRQPLNKYSPPPSAYLLLVFWSYFKCFTSLAVNLFWVFAILFGLFDGINYLCTANTSILIYIYRQIYRHKKRYLIGLHWSEQYWELIISFWYFYFLHYD